MSTTVKQDLNASLKKYFGFDKFKGEQDGNPALQTEVQPLDKDGNIDNLEAVALDDVLDN